VTVAPRADDELKPLTGTWTDSLAELGNAQRDHASRCAPQRARDPRRGAWRLRLRKPLDASSYSGVALTLVDALDTLAVLASAARRSRPHCLWLTARDAAQGNKTEFARSVKWVVDNLSFDQDVRCVLRRERAAFRAPPPRLLTRAPRALWVTACTSSRRISACSAASSRPTCSPRTRCLRRRHLPAPPPPLTPRTQDLGLEDYTGGLLRLAHDLGRRLLPAFTASNTAIPYAWVNLRHGVVPGETRETCTAGAYECAPSVRASAVRALS
jgi:hypothetical protein